jgi:hypothetical protein
MWFTVINYYKLAVEEDRDSIFTTMWKPGLCNRISNFEYPDGIVILDRVWRQQIFYSTV